MKKIIFLDIDGTLVDHERYNCVLDSTIDAIQKARANGHKIVLCTGRAKSNVLKELIPFETDGQIYAAGAMLEADGKLLYHICIPADDLKELMDDFRHYHFGFKLEGENESFADEFVLERRKRNAQRTGTLSKEALSLVSAFDREKALINKATLYFESMRDMEAFSKKWISKYDCIFHGKKAHDTHYMSELLISGVNKSSGILKMLEYFKMDLKDTIAFGDSMNDYDMIQLVHTGICMENGSELLKEKAERICGPSYKDSIYQEFLHLGLIK